MDTFRTFCVSLTPEGRDLLLGIRQTGRLAGGVAAVTIRAYVRVSTADRRCELQVRELREHAERQGWQFADIYEDVRNGAKASPSTESSYSRRPSKKIHFMAPSPFFRGEASSST